MKKRRLMILPTLLVFALACVPVALGQTQAPPTPQTDRFVQPPPQSAEPPPVRVGGDIKPPQKIKDVRAGYPTDAQNAGVTGIVVIEVTIGTDGKVRDAVVRRSVPLLDAAALHAVRQWEFAPTIVNGRPVPVITTVTVNFSMQPPAPAASTATPSSGSTTALPPIGLASLPKSTDPDLEQGRLALERRQYEEALKSFRRASDAHNKQCAECFFAMAIAYQGLGAAKNVVENCDRAIELAGSDTNVALQSRQAKGLALQMLADYKDPKRLHEAEMELRAAMAIDPRAPFLHYYLGVVLMQERHDEDGVAELKEELALRPKSIHSDLAASLIANPRRSREAYAPAFSMVTLGREFVELDALRGKVVVLDFWGTWCPPCVKAVPELRDLQKHFGKEAFLLVGISSDTDERVLRDFVEKNQMDWTQYWDRDRKVQQAYDIRAWPTYIVIDDEGIVRLRTTGAGSMQNAHISGEVKRLLKIAASRGKTESR
jgi:TonB family protein